MDYSILLNALVTIILTLYGEPALARNVVDLVLDSFFTFIKDTYFPSLEQDVLNTIDKCFSKATTERDDSIIREMKIRICECFKDHSRIFIDVESEHKRFKLLEEKRYMEPIEYKLR